MRRLRTADLDQWYSKLRRSGAAGGKPLAPNTVMRAHAVLRRALAQGVKCGWLTVSAAANASPPRSKKQHLELPDPADVARLSEAAANVNPSLPTYFRLAAATGARGGDLCALRWKRIGFRQAPRDARPEHGRGGRQAHRERHEDAPGPQGHGRRRDGSRARRAPRGVPSAGGEVSERARSEVMQAESGKPANFTPDEQSMTLARVPDRS
ncbi:MAG: hypothetical protein HYX34_03980 [Actinobacteria bacterium]|nr:hypothetical protein [Actinomycetota bacterium]